jgi:hypothetical protein
MALQKVRSCMLLIDAEQSLEALNLPSVHTVRRTVTYMPSKSDFGFLQWAPGC